MTHTPGPWFIGTAYNDDEGFPEIPIHADVPGHDRGTITPAAVCLQFPNGGRMQLANARLIASAPDLLEALHNAASLLSAYVTDEPGLLALQQARAALAKARGEQ